MSVNDMENPIYVIETATGIYIWGFHNIAIVLLAVPCIARGWETYGEAEERSRTHMNRERVSVRRI